MKVHEIMTGHARSVGPENTLVETAGLMRELDVGALPVYENDRLLGIVTDRDLALRAIADGLDPNSTPVRDVMSEGVVHVYADQEVEDVVRIMEERQIRRVPVLNREERLVGIVSLGDIAISSNPAFSGMALRDVSEPTHPNARQRRLSERSQMSDVPASRRGDGSNDETRADDGAQSRSRAATRRRSPAAKDTSSVKKTTRKRKSAVTRPSAAMGRKSASRTRSPRKASARSSR